MRSLLTLLGLRQPTYEVALDAVAPAEVIPETVSVVAPVTLEPDVIIVTSLGTSTIPLPPVMMHGMVTPSCSLTTGMVSFRKLLPLILYLFCFFLLFIFM